MSYVKVMVDTDIRSRASYSAWLSDEEKVHHNAGIDNSGVVKGRLHQTNATYRGEIMHPLLKIYVWSN